MVPVRLGLFEDNQRLNGGGQTCSGSLAQSKGIVVVVAVATAVVAAAVVVAVAVAVALALHSWSCQGLQNTERMVYL